MKRTFATLVLLTLTTFTQANTVEGNIDRFYSSASGHWAFSMDVAVDPDIKSAICPDGNGFIGYKYNEATLAKMEITRSMLLAAQMASKRIRVSLGDCASNGGNWYGINSVYVYTD